MAAALALDVTALGWEVPEVPSPKGQSPVRGTKKNGEDVEAREKKEEWLKDSVALLV